MRALLLAALLMASPAIAQQAPLTLQQQVEAKLAEAGPGVRFGLVVATLDGREIVSLNPDGRFVPASNTKLFTTLAAFELLPGLDQPDRDGATRVLLRPVRGKAPDVMLEGRGDARLSSAPDCQTDCLATLADAVAARTRRVGAVIGDSRAFLDERWSFGMSWNNIPTRSGTGLGALIIDGNEVALRVAPVTAGQPPRVVGGGYMEVVNEAVTVAAGKSALEVTRLPGSRQVRLSGTVVAGAAEEVLRLGVDDPAHYAAWRLARMLEERGVRVGGAVASLYQPQPSPAVAQAVEVARAEPGPLGEDIATINKVSQNVHAELLLRRLGAARGKPNVAGGLEAVREVLNRASVPERAATLADGSGMSPYNRVSPRGVVTLLRWAAGRPWGAAFRASLPIGGVDGTLGRRFASGALKGRLFAKTGSLTAASAVSGYLLTARGETLVFSALASDVPEDVRATAMMDGALELVAASR
ncbi:D-alanyl-D-alanine carboxypeptidase/D-alanyl-D-alanine endopeptidase [Sphingomonas glaciei]|uniref:D-alanyl-D-alanine carboxypeptidase/D-alanyl-D-alanine-endopeptidase n=1 Tax=Sphingomonas glaciei TaxID=2938948 RepID=A0ABY5MQX2_9SPHN|nr:D-alanyl-D-alanine carboxypeptidase/D-alanyl-D-alanine-endopeptidase [Sphingomonas glaciei]UUR06890.1 D-alanyl-D-alanine carboxypeptidase/D-alanyl-D-alanine-endopeptidase [Sphingomonas glaciei]